MKRTMWSNGSQFKLKKNVFPFRPFNRAMAKVPSRPADAVRGPPFAVSGVTAPDTALLARILFALAALWTHRAGGFATDLRIISMKRF